MADWTYQIIDQSGKERKGNIVAESEAEAKNKLKMDGNMVISLTKATALTKEISFSVGGKVKPRDLSVFCRQFTSMVNAGVTILDTLDMLSDQTENKVMAKAIRGVHAEIQKGETLSDGLKKYPNVFPDIMVSMVAAGEASGKIDVAFDRMSAHFEKSAKLNGMIKKAAVYPIIVVIVAIAVVIVMLVKVIPSYSEMFNDLGTELPGITKALIATSDFITNYWWSFILIVLAFFIGRLLLKKNEQGRAFLAENKLKRSPLKKMHSLNAASQFASTMSTMLTAGLPITKALEVTANVADNYMFAVSIRKVRQGVEQGRSLADCMSEIPYFPKLLTEMVGVGERSGNMEETLTVIGDYFDNEVSVFTQRLLSMLEPAITIVLAVVTVILLLAVYLPMFTMYGSIV